MLRLARESGCLYLFIGLESFSSEGLASVNKSINNVATYGSTIRSIHEHGISVQAGLIFGFDTDRTDVFQRTLAACEAIGIDGATPSLLTPLPGTPLYNKWKESGRLRFADWNCYNGKTHVAFEPRNMTAEELYEGYMWFRKKFYFTGLFRKVDRSAIFTPKTNPIVIKFHWCAAVLAIHFSLSPLSTVLRVFESYWNGLITFR